MSAGAGFDPGRRKLRLASVRRRKGGVAVTCYRTRELAEGEGPLDGAAAFPRPKVGPVRAGATGADVMIRYLPVPQVEDWRLERLMSFEVRELESRAGARLATSYNLLPVPKESDEEDTILLALVREDLLEGWTAALRGFHVQGYTPSAIALYNAWLALGDHEPSVTLLAHLGAATLDLVLVRGADLYFARSVTTGLEKRDRTLAERLGIAPARAERLIRRHLDLGGAIGKRLDPDADRVTRPLLPLYEPLPTLLSSMVTLCKAQARLRELSLDRVLLCGGAAQTRGLADFLTERMRVPVAVWNPVELVDAAALPEADAAELAADGPGSAVVLGLALSAADPGLYALEILPEKARRRRSFRERGAYTVAAGVLAAAFLVADFAVTSARAGEAARVAARLTAEAQAAERDHERATRLREQIAAEERLAAELAGRYAVRRSLQEFLSAAAAWLPEDLWVQTLKVELEDGDEWGLKGREIPVLTATGRGVSGARRADTEFTEFAAKLKEHLPGGEDSIRYEAHPKGRELEWTVRAQLTRAAPAREEAAGEEKRP